MTARWWEWVAALLGKPKPVPREMDQALERDGLTPEELDDYHANGGGIAPPTAPHIPDDGSI